jgi:hypothetical protein
MNKRDEDGWDEIDCEELRKMDRLVNGTTGFIIGAILSAVIIWLKF